MTESEKICSIFLGRKLPLNTAGQTRETIAFTQQEYAAGRMSKEEKLRLDNLSIRNNSLSQLYGIETFADEQPGEWNKYEANVSHQGLEP